MAPIKPPIDKNEVDSDLERTSVFWDRIVRNVHNYKMSEYRVVKLDSCWDIDFE